MATGDLLYKLCGQELLGKIFRREIFNAKRLRLAMATGDLLYKLCSKNSAATKSGKDSDETE